MPTSHPTELQSINYGHFGTPLYIPTLKKWAFSKNTESHTRYEQLGTTEELAPGTGAAQQQIFLRDEVDDREERYDRALETEIRQLVVVFPEIQPAEAYIKPIVRLSEGVARALTEYDPAAGNLLARGNVSRTLEHGVDTIALLAIPGGECGECLRLVRLHSQDYGFDDGNVFSMDMASNEVGWWTGKGAPLQQICFSRSLGQDDKNSLLAIRLSGGIIIMYPRYRARPAPAPGIELETPPEPSCIDPNILFELSPRKAQGVQFADVTFNPWNQREFVVIDQAGQWTTFSIERKSERSPVYKPKLVMRGQMPQLPEDEDGVDNEEGEQLASTASALEVVQTETTSQESREQSRDEAMRIKGEALESASGSSSPGLEAISPVPIDDGTSVGDLSVPNAEDETTSVKPKLRQDGWARIIWILDKKTLIACTRKDIYIIDASTAECLDFPRLLPESKRQAGWYLDLVPCRNHPNYVFVLTSKSIFLVQVIRASSPDKTSERVCKGKVVISALHFRDTADLTLRIYAASDNNGYLITIYSQYNTIATCFHFELPDDPNEQASVSDAIPLAVPERDGDRILAMTFKRLSLGEYSPEGEEEFATSSVIKNLHSLQFLGRDFTLRHLFFQGLGQSSRKLPFAPRSMGSLQIDDSTKFVVSDTFVDEPYSDEDDSGPEENLSNNLIGPKHKRQQIQFRDAAKATEGTENLDADELVPNIRIDDVSATIQTAIHTVKASDGPQKTLFEYVDRAIVTIDDLRDASFELEDAFACSTPSAAVRMYTQAMPVPLPDEGAEEMPFDDIHAYLEDNYVLPIGGGFPRAFLEQRVELAKSMAAEIMLASSRIEFVGEMQKENEPAVMDGTKIYDQFAGESQHTEAISHGEDGREGRSVQPTPSATGSRASRSRSPYTVPINSTMNEIVERLQRNVNLSIKQTQQWSLRPMVILNHWELGVNPNEYSYRETKKRLDEERDFVGLSEKDQRRLLRRQERDQLRREREARRAERLTQETSQAPAILSSQVPRVGSQTPARSQSRASARASPAPSIQASQGPALSSQAPGVKSSQVPGLGSQKAPNTRAKSVPGFGSQPVARSLRSRPAAGLGTPPATGSQAQSASQVSVKNSRAEKEKGLGSQDTGGPSQSFELPVRHTAAALSQPLASQDISSQRTVTSSQKLPPRQSQRLASQVSGSQTPKKKKRRAEGF